MVPTNSSNTSKNSTRFDWKSPAQCGRHTTGPGMEQFHERAHITSLVQSAGRVLQLIPKTKEIK
eukprot:14241422-Ditylum_brightwellii.AAC.1